MRFMFILSATFVMLVIVYCIRNTPERIGGLQKEKGYIVAKQYLPDTRETHLGTGISSRGSTIITTHETGHEEKFMVVLRCEHKTVFSVNDPKLYAGVEEGDSVVINYYNMATKDRPDSVVDYDFVSAAKIENGKK